MKTTTYTIDGKDFELRHYGVKGMKWGRRKARPQATSMGRSSGQVDNSPEAQAAAKAARKQKLKRAAKIGAAVVGTTLAVYGAKKLHDVVRDKNYQYRMQQGKKLCDDYIRKTSDLHYNTDWRVRRQQEDRDSKYFKQVFDSASRQADNDSFARAVRNVAGEYLLKEPERARVSRAKISRAKVARANVSRASW